MLMFLYGPPLQLHAIGPAFLQWSPAVWRPSETTLSWSASGTSWIWISSRNAMKCDSEMVERTAGQLLLFKERNLIETLEIMRSRMNHSGLSVESNMSSEPLKCFHKKRWRDCERGTREREG